MTSPTKPSRPDARPTPTYEEPTLSVGRLAIPTDHTLADIAGFASIPAVAEFVKAMKAVDPDFTPDCENIDLIARVCAASRGLVADLRLVARMAYYEGLQAVTEALTSHRAQELVSTWTERYSQSARSIDVTSPSYAILGYAYYLRAGFGVEAMRHISGITDAGKMLRDLVQKSLVDVTVMSSGTLAGTTEQRFHVPFSAIPAARESAAYGDSLGRTTQVAHAAYFGRLTQVHCANITNWAQRTSVRVLYAETYNIVAAMAHLIATGPDESVVYTLRELVPFWIRYGQVNQALLLLRKLLSHRQNLDDRLGFSVSLIAADAFVKMGEFETAGELLDELAPAMSIAEDVDVGMLAHIRGLTATSENMESGIRYLRTAVDQLSDHGEPCTMDSSRFRLDLSWAEYLAGHPDAAALVARRALADATLRGDDLTAGAALLRLVAFGVTDNRSRIHTLFERALTRLRKLGPRVVIGELAEVVGSHLVAGPKAKASNIARLLGSYYARYNGPRSSQTSAYAIRDKELETLQVIDRDTYIAMFHEGARTSLLDLVTGMAGRQPDAHSPTALDTTCQGGLDGGGRDHETDGSGSSFDRVGLTLREVEVARLVADGLTNKAVAHQLAISEWTVVNHMRHIMRKLGCSSRVQVARWADSSIASGERARD